MRRAFIAIVAACAVLASSGAVHAQSDEYKDAEQIIHEHCKQEWPTLTIFATVIAFFAILTGAAAPAVAGLALWAIAVATILPIVVACRRGHKNLIPIVLTTIFFGWTFVGWAAALIWSFSDNIGPDARYRNSWIAPSIIIAIGYLVLALWMNDVFAINHTTKI